MPDRERSSNCNGRLFERIGRIEYLMAGARAVEIHTVFMREGVGYVQQMISQMTEFLRKKGISRSKI